jgi:8-oxo-dGTP pyrophosphatase MutT (NUDIX family)
VEASQARGRVGLGVSGSIVHAAGGVPWRRRNGRLEILVVHRPKYDDWSFPKGKNLPGESDEDCVVREVAEETNLSVTLGEELATVFYESKGKPKRVRYWALDPQDPNEARPTNEIDQLAWLEPDDASRRLTYEHDGAVLRSFLASAWAKAAAHPQ